LLAVFAPRDQSTCYRFVDQQRILPDTRTVEAKRKGTRSEDVKVLLYQPQDCNQVLVT
jgi:hypothetical protein